MPKSTSHHIFITKTTLSSEKTFIYKLLTFYVNTLLNGNSFAVT